MPAKVVLLHAKAREGVLAGVNLLADVARVTLGPRGRNVMLQKSWGAPTVTKDGVTVVKEIELEDRFENIGARMVREVAQKTSDVAGTKAIEAIAAMAKPVKERERIAQVGAVSANGDVTIGDILAEAMDKVG